MTGSAAEYKIAPSFLDGWKRVFLGKPMITEDLQHEKLSNPVALGALSPDAISSTAYGPEQIMIENEKLQRVRVALQYLPAQQRECVLLRSQGLRYREIASNLGVSTQRVATLMGRGISRLVSIL